MFVCSNLWFSIRGGVAVPWEVLKKKSLCLDLSSPPFRDWLSEVGAAGVPGCVCEHVYFEKASPAASGRHWRLESIVLEKEGKLNS